MVLEGCDEACLAQIDVPELTDVDRVIVVCQGHHFQCGGPLPEGGRVVIVQAGQLSRLLLQLGQCILQACMLT